jgi:outer membrane protein assembly factor BamB
VIHLRTAALLVATVGSITSCGGSRPTSTQWPLANFDLSSTRSVPKSGINRTTVRHLHVVWRFRFKIPPREAGVVTATPIATQGLILTQDMQSNVFALDRATGKVRWRHMFRARNGGPNGLAIAGDRVYGATDTGPFALSMQTGRLIWMRSLVRPGQPFVDVAPQVAGGIVYVSTIGLPPNGRGALYAVDARTGLVRWKRSTIAKPWRVPNDAGGGGAWYPPSVDGKEVYLGTANPYPYGGTRRHPNGGAFAGAALYTDSLLVVDASSGKLRWYDQVTPHDVRDHDFQLSPVLGSSGGTRMVFGAGKAGIVIAWNRITHGRVWTTKVGVHRNDSGPLPQRRVPVCPGLFGGVETPMALAEGALFVPVVDLCSSGSAYGYESLSKVDPSGGRGELVALDAASGRRLWVRRLPQPDFGCATVADGVVFTSTFDGTVYAFDTRDGSELWNHRMQAGVNACPALSGDLLLVGAGIPLPGRRALELVAFAPG